MQAIFTNKCEDLTREIFSAIRRDFSGLSDDFCLCLSNNGSEHAIKLKGSKCKATLNILEGYFRGYLSALSVN